MPRVNKALGGDGSPAARNGTRQRPADHLGESGFRNISAVFGLDRPEFEAWKDAMAPFMEDESAMRRTSPTS
jgi:hypothetical protein